MDNAIFMDIGKSCNKACNHKSGLFLIKSNFCSKMESKISTSHHIINKIDIFLILKRILHINDKWVP